MPRVLKIHLLRADEGDVMDPYTGLCGKVTTENGTRDVEEVTCNTCSGIYRTNVEWYSQIHNKAVEAKGVTGSGDIYTRQDVEIGLMRLGMGMSAITAILDKTYIFRNVFMEEERTGKDPWPSTLLS